MYVLTMIRCNALAVWVVELGISDLLILLRDALSWEHW